MQSQDRTSKTTVKVPKRKVLRAKGKKIKEALNMLIQVLEESRHIWDAFFYIKLYGLHDKLFTFFLVYLFSLVYFYLDLLPFLALGVIRLKIVLDILFLFPL